MQECVFCQLVRGELPRTVVYEDREILAFPSIRPQAEVHLLIIPKEHMDNLLDVTEEKLSIFGRIQAVAAKLVEDKQITDGYRLVLNGGRYQEVPHVHYHLLGGTMKGGEN